MGKDTALNAILAEIRKLGTRVDDLGTRMTAIKPLTQNLHEEEPEDQNTSEVPEASVRQVRGRVARYSEARASQNLPEGRETLSMHGVQEDPELGFQDLSRVRGAREFDRDRRAQEMYGNRRVTQDLHRGRVTRDLHRPRHVREWPAGTLTEDSVDDELPPPPPQRRVGPRRWRDYEDLSIQERAPRVQAPSLKLSAPTFAGKVDPEAYLDWEQRMDHIFGVYDYSESQKVQYAVAQLTGDAKTWWDREEQYLRRTRSGPVASWDLMKFIMNRRYVPPFYFKGLQKKFRNLTQGSRSVEEYLEEFEHLRDRLQLEYDEETLMTHFRDGLHDRIARQVERRVYRGFEELVHLAIQIETPINRRSANISRSRVQAPAPRVPQMPVLGSSSPPARVDTAVDHRVLGIPNVPTKDIRDEVRIDITSVQTHDDICAIGGERGHIPRDCPNQTAMILKPSGEIESLGIVESHAEHAEHLDDEDLCPKVREDLALRIVTEGPMVIVRLWNWSWLRNVFLGDIPTGLPPQRGIELQFDQALGTLHTVHSPPLILYKEEPPDSILDLGCRAVPLVFVHYRTLLSALMLATRLFCFAGANKEFRDDQWVKEKPPDVGHELPLVVTSGRSRSETRHSVSYTLTFDLSNFVNSGLELIAYDREPDRLGVAHASLDWSCFIVGLDPRFRQGIWDCLCFDALLDNLMLATRSCFIAGTSRVDRIDQWVKEKPPDSSILLLGDGAGDDHTNGSKLGGKVDTTLDFNENDLVYVAAGNVSVLRTKPREEGGDDEILDQQLVPEHVAEELGARRIGGMDSVGCLGVLQGISHLLRRVFGHSAMEGKNMAPSLHW